MTGLISEGEQLPSVRMLSISLGINPNTVQKAYLELEREGVSLSVPGKGCFITKGSRQRLKKSCLGEDGAFSKLVRELKASGFSVDELSCAIKSIFENDQ